MYVDPSMREDDPYLPATWRILAVLLQHPQLSQADLRDRTGLSHPVVVQQVALLRQAGLISIGRPLSGSPGRPRIPMAFNWDFRRLLAVEVHPSGITTQAVNLACDPVEEAVVTPLVAWTWDGVRRALVKALRTAWQSKGAPWVGIGIVLPDDISQEGGKANELWDLPEWCEEPLIDELAREFSIPIWVENGADALAYAVRAVRPNDWRNMLCVSLRHPSAVNLSMVVNGNLVRPAGGQVSGIEHLPVPGNTRVCSCGRTGCLATLIRAAQSDLSVREEAIHSLGEALSRIVTLFNLDHLLLQGDKRWSASDLEVLTAALRAHACPGIEDSLRIEERPSRATENLTGIARYMAERVLDLRTGMVTGWVRLAIQTPQTHIMA